MIAPPQVEYRLTPGLGWPLCVEVDPRIGWPNVPRETLDWPARASVPLTPNGSSVTTAGTGVIEIPPGPRRARFDEDEFAPPAVEDDPPATSPAAAVAPIALPAPPETRILVVANQKGGVGKTTTSVNLAVALALGGLSVLVVDLDPQGNATTALGVDHPPGTPGTYEVLMSGAALADHVVDSPEAPHLEVLPATIDLAGAEIELVSIVARENRLKRSVRIYLQNHHADYVFLDCPPSLGLLTLNALVAANEILVPIQCEYYALEGVTQLLRTIDLVKGELNDDLRLSTVLLTMYDGRTKLAAQVADEVRRHFAAETLPTVIPRSVRISEAPSYGQSVLTYQPSSAGAISYLEAAQEIARRGVEENP
jgi:chromosome partitioning protein